MDAKRLSQIQDYIASHVGHMDRYFGPMFDPSGRKVLVIGCGWGVETYWCLLRGAAFVVGFDPAPRDTAPLVAALNANNSQLKERFTHHQCLIEDVPTTDVDAILSNNVFEHIDDVEGTLASCRRFMTKRHSRLHIFTDPLYYSSAGSHLPVSPWRHLRIDSAALKREAGAGSNWQQFENGLNRMTLLSFLNNVETAGMWIESLSIVPDRNRKSYAADRPQIAPMTALLEGIACTLAFPENI